MIFTVQVFDGKGARAYGNLVQRKVIEAANMLEALDVAAELAEGRNHVVQRGEC